MVKETLTFITGATRGMGKEIAKELAATGQHVLIGARKLEAGESIAAELRKQGFTADSVQIDVTDDASVRAAAEKVTHDYGYLSILINNAGINVDKRQPASSLSIAVIRKEFEVNFYGVIRTTQAFLPLLKKVPRAKILMMSSMMGSIGSALDPTTTVYRAVSPGYQSSKAALNMYSVQLAKELVNGDSNITVNLVDPGLVATEFATGNPEIAKSMGGKTVEAGASRMVALATDWNNTDTATYTNSEGSCPW